MGTNSTFAFEKITNYLAILRLRKPPKTSTGLAGHAISSQDLRNASIMRYHRVTSLGVYLKKKKLFQPK